MLRAGRSSPPPRSYAGRNPNPCKLLQGRVPGTRVASETEAAGIGSSAAFTGHRCAWRITRVCPENLGCSQQPRESLLLFQRPCESRSQHGWLRNPPFTLRSTHPEPTFCSCPTLRPSYPAVSCSPTPHQIPPAHHTEPLRPPSTAQGTADPCHPPHTAPHHPPRHRCRLPPAPESIPGARGARGGPGRQGAQ